MKFMALFFLCVRMYHFVNTQRIYYFLQNFEQLRKERKAHPERRHVIIIDSSSTVFLLYFILDVLFLLFCVALMMADATWRQGILLLLIVSTETLAIRARVDGTYITDQNGFIYPHMWLRNLTFVESGFILLKIFQS